MQLFIDPVNKNESMTRLVANEFNSRLLAGYSSLFLCYEAEPNIISLELAVEVARK